MAAFTSMYRGVADAGPHPEHRAATADITDDAIGGVLVPAVVAIVVAADGGGERPVPEACSSTRCCDAGYVLASSGDVNGADVRKLQSGRQVDRQWPVLRLRRLGSRKGGGSGEFAATRGRARGGAVPGSRVNGCQANVLVEALPGRTTNHSGDRGNAFVPDSSPTPTAASTLSSSTLPGRSVAAGREYPRAGGFPLVVMVSAVRWDAFQ